jgi:site-specific DNA recombinase
MDGQRWCCGLGPEAVTAKIDRYLDAFEDGKLNGDDQDINARLAKLRAKRQQLRDRKTELERLMAEQPTAPDPATLEHVAQHIGQIVRAGHVNEQKTLIENLVAYVTISGIDRFVPTFRVPQRPATSAHEQGAEAVSTASTPGVRMPTHLVDRLPSVSDDPRADGSVPGLLNRADARYAWASE